MSTAPTTAAQAPLSIAPGFDPAAARPVLQRFGRLHIPGFFVGDGAARVHASLVSDCPWMRSTMVEGKNVDARLDFIASLSPEEVARVERDQFARARTGFQYSFDNYRLSDAIEAGRRHGWAFEAVYDFMNGPFLPFVRALTGDDRAAYCDAQATRYQAGHYLTQHHDDEPGRGRLYAYVLNFTPAWRADWGGILQFLDADGHVAEGYTPSFNALNIFRVPQDHCVSYVAPFAGGDRLSITGWVRTHRDPPRG
ncbi:2OG-Fe(II) oxygenase family protein [Caulobacter sp. 17J80-11]|uniref:2OG-Fe(II) oxygenase n=1 Tax=Caulobacter sp. 17J80-11 TaxID=2763502 RepID=UPI0016538DF7|nr:2OG-Fe(II) oxygenase family protein [Caulobacter sp. 17J80-11]MBC6982815.1 2OG-Fe(II) oxygenase [Caulobacter sp. 17J80-11]